MSCIQQIQNQNNANCKYCPHKAKSRLTHQFQNVPIEKENSGIPPFHLVIRILKRKFKIKFCISLHARDPYHDMFSVLEQSMCTRKAGEGHCLLHLLLHLLPADKTRTDRKDLYLKANIASNYGVTQEVTAHRVDRSSFAGR